MNKFRKGDIYEALYKDNKCEDKLNEIEEILINSEPFEEGFSKMDNFVFWFFISGAPFIIGFFIGWWLL